MVSLPVISRKKKDKLIFGVLIATLLAIVWALSFQFSTLAGGSANQPDLTISFYDVGQGDSILLERGETQILVDGGPGDDILSYLGQDMAPWDRTLELVILTHPHADHLTGLLSVLERYQVEQILFYPVSHDSKAYQRFLEVVRQLADDGVAILKGEAGVVIELSGVNLQVLWPQDGFSDTNINNNSVVLAVNYGEFDVLLLGDAEREAQIRFTPVISEVEVLKVAHQGAQDGAYEPLLGRASPELAVISVGAGNSYGHPHQVVLDLLGRLGITVLRTDLSGTVRVSSDGDEFWYDTER